MIRHTATQILPEPAQGKPVASAEQWLGRNASSRQHLWERLNPRHRKQLRLLARALVLRQEKARLPEPARTKLSAALDELERLANRIEQLLAALTNRTPPPR
jgi:anion-transporting  ArsA/GET3 family ATPase